VNKGKLLGGAVVAISLVAGLYLANRYWITPVVLRAKASASTHANADSDHPLAPNFTLTELSGQKLNLADYKGKVVLLDFWATWCGPCRMEIPGFIELQNRYRDQGFTVIGVDMDKDGPEPVKEFYQELKMNYPVVLNNPSPTTDEKVDMLYGGLLGLPTAFLIGRDGRIYAKHSGAAPTSVFEEEVKTLLSAQGTGAAQDFHPVNRGAPQEKIELSTPEEVNSEVPGVDISKLTDGQKTEFKKVLSKDSCTCNGCKYNLLDCRRYDSSCPVSRQMAKDKLAALMGHGEPASSAKASATPAPGAAASARE